jgi:hypothetical protein
MKLPALSINLAIAVLVVACPEPARAEPPPPAPYSLAWQLRPAAAGNVVRSDTTFATYEDADGDGATVASTFLASYKVTPTLAPLFRVAVSYDDPAAADGAASMSNPLLGATWAPKLAPPLKLAVFGAVTIPVGSGGGNSPGPSTATNRSAVFARSAMDNALFAVNDATAIAGADLAYVKNGLTVQAEVTLFELIRVRGDQVQPDKAKTNFTSGLHAGYFPLPYLSVGAELRYQRYLSTPMFVEATPALRDTVSAAIGVRGHIKMGGKRWLRPGIAYSRGLDDPMSGRSYDVVQVDVPYSF